MSLRHYNGYGSLLVVRTGMAFIQVYRGEHSGPLSLAAEEIEEGRWLKQSEVSSQGSEDDASLTETFKVIWRRFQTE